MTLRIKNWSRHQHFKDRTPPWIKLYRELLNDPDWHDLDGDTSKVLIGLWLIASEDETHQGLLPDVRKLAFRLRISERSLNQALTKLSAWLIQDDIAVISGRYQVDALETETETETETEAEAETEERPRATKSRRATHLPAEWMPSDSDIAFCRRERPELDPSRVADRFRDYWVAKGGADGRKTDWAATWRNWVRNERSPSVTPVNGKHAERQRIAAEISAIARGANDGTVIDITPRTAAAALGRPVV